MTTLMRMAPGRRHRAMLGAAVLAAALGGCADLGTSEPASASVAQPASWQVAGPVFPSHTTPLARQTPAQSCDGGASGFVDNCGPFVRYDGP